MYGRNVMGIAGVALRPILESDIAWLYELETHPEIIQRFRLGGTTPSPYKYREFLERECSVRYLVVSEENGERIGFVYAFGTDLENKRTSIALVAHPDQHGTGKLYRGVLSLLTIYLNPFRPKESTDRVWNSISNNFHQTIIGG